MNQIFIDHNDMCSTPPAKVLPPQLGVPPAFLRFFLPPRPWQISEVLPPQLKLGGTNYDTPIQLQSSRRLKIGEPRVCNVRAAWSPFWKKTDGFKRTEKSLEGE